MKYWHHITSLCLFTLMHFTYVAQDTPSHHTACNNPTLLTNHTNAIKNFCVVTPDVLWRGGKPSRDGAQALLDLKVKTIVNLELLFNDEDNFAHLPAKPDAHANQHSEPHTIHYFRIREWEPNSVLRKDKLDQHVAQFIAIMQTQAKPAYVHCRSGENRTGIMVAAYRVLIENQEVETAIKEMQGFKGLWVKPATQYIRSLQGERKTQLLKIAEAMQSQLKQHASIVCGDMGCKVME